jgi:hypothetical protein
MTFKIFGHTGHYRYIDGALRARWDSFLALEREMKSFAPRPIAEFATGREAELERIRELNPTAPIDELANMVDVRIKHEASFDTQFFEAFDQKHMAEFVAVVLLAHALSEALINGVLAIGLASVEATCCRADWLMGKRADSTMGIVRVTVARAVLAMPIVESARQG